MKIVCISDTHDNHNQIKIPKCDLLIVAGDFTCHRDPVIANYKSFNDWLGIQPAKHRIVVAGNHDTLFEQQPELARQLLTNATYLQDSGTTVGELKIWGSPWTPLFANWAFMKPDEELMKYWNQIPLDTDILVTHGGPFKILDKSGERYGGLDCGSKSLTHMIDHLSLKLHIFGHIHESFGVRMENGTTFINAAQCDEYNNLVNEPVVIEL